MASETVSKILEAEQSVQAQATAAREAAEAALADAERQGAALIAEAREQARQEADAMLAQGVC